MKIKIPEVLVGSDIEVFLADEERYISSVGKIEGTKNEPYELAKEGCCTQLDNVSTEFNVPPVGIFQADLMGQNIGFVKSYLAEKFKEHGLRIVCCASAEFNLDQLMTPEANIFGCDPDFNAWKSGMVNDKDELENPYMRCAGGHVHIGYPKSNDKTNMEIIKAMDITLGVPSIFMDPDRVRRTLYGQAGAFRHKPFGVEYRVLSNFWIENQDFINWVFKGVQQALEMVNNKVDFIEDAENVALAINTYNEEVANSLIEKYDVDVLIPV